MKSSKTTTIQIATCAILFIWAVATSSADAQNLISNGSFETPTVSPNTLMLTNPAAWSETDVAIINGDYSALYPLPANGQQYLALGRRPSKLSQQFAINWSGTYVLAWFDSCEYNPGVGQSAPYSVRLIDSANNVVASGEFDANPSALRVWAARSLEFSLVQGNYTLQFEGQSTGDVGATALIDDVSLQNPDGDLLASIRPAVEICWAGRTNQMYQVQFCTSLIDTNWCDLGSSVQGAGTNRITDPVSGGQRFYRVIRVP